MILILIILIILILILYVVIAKSIFYYKIYEEERVRDDVMKRKKIDFIINIEDEGKNIPHIIMQTYKSINSVPELVFDNIKNQNPDWEYNFLDDKEIEKFLKKEYPPQILQKFNSFSHGAHRADLFRLCWLYKKGGVYVDIDTQLLKPLNQIIKDKKLIIPITDVDGSRKRLLNCFMVSKKGNPLILECIKSVMKINNKDLYNNYRLILRVMEKTIEGKYNYEFIEKRESGGLFGKEEWAIFDQENQKIANSKYKNYDQHRGFLI